jgi:hypothetical protein
MQSMSGVSHSFFPPVYLHPATPHRNHPTTCSSFSLRHPSRSPVILRKALSSSANPCHPPQSLVILRKALSSSAKPCHPPRSPVILREALSSSAKPCHPSRSGGPAFALSSPIPKTEPPKNKPTQTAYQIPPTCSNGNRAQKSTKPTGNGAFPLKVTTPNPNRLTTLAVTPLE